MSQGIPRVLSESLGGSPLARAGMAGRLPEWYVRRPSTVEEWRERMEGARHTAGPWLDDLRDALAPTVAARERLERVAKAGGVVVTTGQQPGLFGGPLYTLNKALGALELANALEAATGVPTAPVFWAATDDADFAEACFTWVHRDGGAVRVAQDQVPTEGIPMSEVPLAGISGAMDELFAAAGSAADVATLAAVRAAYVEGSTVGGAYLALMRRLLEPLGVAVIDASHPDLLRRERPVLRGALERAAAIATALSVRERELRERGYAPQVPGIDTLSLVFSRMQGRKARVPVSEAAAVAARDGDVLSPNVLLRPVVERALLPTVAYVAGPGEFAYFAQVGAVASVLGAEPPLAVPRWSCTLLEPHVEAGLSHLGVAWRELEVEHAVERRLAVASLPLDLMSGLADLRAAAQSRGEAFKSRLVQAGSPIDPRIVDGTIRAMSWRIDRLERRLVAAAKRKDSDGMRALATARGSLFPGGTRQERALSFIPFLATYGAPLLAQLRAAARRHAEALVHGRDIPIDQ